MKKKITTLFVALCLVGATSAQQTNCQINAGSDSKLLSQCTQGDYTVSRYLVKETNTDNNEFSVRYKINLSRLISTYDNNSEELKGLRSFIEELQQDSLKSITAINVTGFASPDGVKASNERLAMERAQDFRQYLNKNYNVSKYEGLTTADALSWSATIPDVTSSSIPNKSGVLEVLNGGYSAEITESKIKAMPQSWSYMKQHILPPMRSVELWVKYNSWRVVETRTLNSARQQSEGTTTVNYIMIVEENPEALVISPSNAPLDYDNAKFKEKFKIDRRREKLKEKSRMGYRHSRLYEKGKL